MSVTAGNYHIYLKSGAMGLGMSTEGNYCCITSGSEIWTVSPAEGTDAFFLTHEVYSGVEVSPYFDKDGNPILLGELDRRNAQFVLVLDDVGDGWVAINNHDRTRVFDAAGNNPVIGVNVNCWKWNGGDNQKWQFVPA